MALHLLPAAPAPTRRRLRGPQRAAGATPPPAVTLATLRRRIATACLGCGFALAAVAIAVSVQALSWA